MREIQLSFVKSVTLSSFQPATDNNKQNAAKKRN